MFNFIISILLLIAVIIILHFIISVSGLFKRIVSHKLILISEIIGFIISFILGLFLALNIIHFMSIINYFILIFFIYAGTFVLIVHILSIFFPAKVTDFSREDSINNETDILSYRIEKSSKKNKIQKKGYITKNKINKKKIDSKYFNIINEYNNKVKIKKADILDSLFEIRKLPEDKIDFFILFDLINWCNKDILEETVNILIHYNKNIVKKALIELFFTREKIIQSSYNLQLDLINYFNKNFVKESFKCVVLLLKSPHANIVLLAIETLLLFDNKAAVEFLLPIANKIGFSPEKKAAQDAVKHFQRFDKDDVSGELSVADYDDIGKLSNYDDENKGNLDIYKKE